MKRILFIAVLILVSTTTYCQIGVVDAKNYITCIYDKAYLKSDNTGIISFEDFEVSYKKETKEYIIKVFIDRGTIYTFNLKYDKTAKDGSDIAYFYKGVRSNFMNEPVVVFSRTKLSAYTKNAGFKSYDEIKDFDKQAISFIFPKTYLIFSIAPIKNTSEAHKLKKEKEQREEAKRIAKEKAKNTLEKLLPLGEELVKDSLKREFVEEFFNNKGEIESSYLKDNNDYIAVIDTNKQVRFIQKGNDVFDKSLKNEYSNSNVEYEKEYAKVINGRVFFKIMLNVEHETEMIEHSCSIRYDKRNGSYIYSEISCQSNSRNKSCSMEVPKEIKEIIENKIKKKGAYSLNWKTLGGKLVTLSCKKQVSYVTNRKVLYSIYEKQEN